MAISRGAVKVPHKSIGSKHAVRQAHSLGQKCKTAQSSTAQKANDLVRSNQGTREREDTITDWGLSCYVRSGDTKNQ